MNVLKLIGWCEKLRTVHFLKRGRCDDNRLNPIKHDAQYSKILGCEGISTL